MNYVELEQEEMMYLDGADATNFCNNLEGVWNSWSINVSKARVAAGWSWALFSKS
ncbi:hypothetical protein [Erysipelothrix larvae]|uniref:hypothetical protein n=1 Tax=Erysipelothrix larvae TaxID=1514105 RepID=UPI000A8669F1|nr:hypothetical protein [Erysipelothrix larvae]